MSGDCRKTGVQFLCGRYSRTADFIKKSESAVILDRHVVRELAKRVVAPEQYGRGGLEYPCPHQINLGGLRFELITQTHNKITISQPIHPIFVSSFIKFIYCSYLYILADSVAVFCCHFGSEELSF